jgi:hypothetical protein
MTSFPSAYEMKKIAYDAIDTQIVLNLRGFLHNAVEVAATKGLVCVTTNYGTCNRAIPLVEKLLVDLKKVGYVVDHTHSTESGTDHTHHTFFIKWDHIRL